MILKFCKGGKRTLYLNIDLVSNARAQGSVPSENKTGSVFLMQLACRKL